MKRLSAFILCSAVCASFLSACGIKGPLYMPPEVKTPEEIAQGVKDDMARKHMRTVDNCRVFVNSDYSDQCEDMQYRRAKDLKHCTTLEREKQRRACFSDVLGADLSSKHAPLYVEAEVNQCLTLSSRKEQYECLNKAALLADTEAVTARCDLIPDLVERENCLLRFKVEKAQQSVTSEIVEKDLELDLYQTTPLKDDEIRDVLKCLGNTDKKKQEMCLDEAGASAFDRAMIKKCEAIGSGVNYDNCILKYTLNRYHSIVDTKTLIFEKNFDELSAQLSEQALSYDLRKCQTLVLKKDQRLCVRNKVARNEALNLIAGCENERDADRRSSCLAKLKLNSASYYEAALLNAKKGESELEAIQLKALVERQLEKCSQIENQKEQQKCIKNAPERAEDESVIAKCDLLSDDAQRENCIQLHIREKLKQSLDKDNTRIDSENDEDKSQDLPLSKEEY